MRSPLVIALKYSLFWSSVPNRETAEHHGGEKGTRQAETTLLLDQQAEFQKTLSGAAVLFGEADAHQAEFGHLLPQFGGVPLGILWQGPDEFPWAFVLQKFPRRAFD